MNKAKAVIAIGDLLGEAKLDSSRDSCGECATITITISNIVMSERLFEHFLESSPTLKLINWQGVRPSKRQP